MAEAHPHLTCQKRCHMTVLLESGMSHAQVARRLDVHRSTIGRELKRNSTGEGYCPEEADRMARARRSAASSIPWKMTPEKWKTIEHELRTEQSSPEQISGRFKLLGVMDVSHERIYQHIREDHDNGGDLIQFTRRRGKKPNRKGKANAGRGMIPNRRDISERPKVVERKHRRGDFETDTVVGKRHSGALMTAIDRKSWYVKIRRVDRKTSEEVGGALVSALEAIGGPVRTITSDNGKEFAGHEKVAKALSADFFFAEAYHAWQRGQNEHINGDIRRFFPKSTDFRKVADNEVQELEDRLNRRPRKVLGFRTPEEVYFQRRPRIPDHLAHLAQPP